MTGHFSALKARKPKSACESIQVVETIVAENQAVDLNPSPLKRRFSEVESDLMIPRIKKERSPSSESTFSDTTSTSVSHVKMEVDEETSKAASILKGVSMDARNVPSPRKARANLGGTTSVADASIFTCLLLTGAKPHPDDADFRMMRVHGPHSLVQTMLFG
jgi:hypothetical protein